MFYESGMNPNRWGGAGGRYYGLIQFGPEERAKYGVRPGESSGIDQVAAAENYLRDRGLKPGMGMLDLYSTVNAGRPGLYSRSDANNGGLPGTVADKVASPAMAAHRARADALLGLQGGGGAVPAVQAQAAPSPASSAPLSLAPIGGGEAAPDDAIAKALAAFAAPQQAEASQFAPVPAMQMHAAPLPVNPQLMRRVLPSAVARARAMAAAMSRAT